MLGRPRSQARVGWKYKLAAEEIVAAQTLTIPTEPLTCRPLSEMPVSRPNPRKGRPKRSTQDPVQKYTARVSTGDHGRLQGEVPRRSVDLEAGFLNHFETEWS